MANSRRCDVCLLESTVFPLFLILISFVLYVIDRFNNISLTILFHFQAVYFYCSQFSSNLSADKLSFNPAEAIYCCYFLSASRVAFSVNLNRPSSTLLDKLERRLLSAGLSEALISFSKYYCRTLLKT